MNRHSFSHRASGAAAIAVAMCSTSALAFEYNLSTPLTTPSVTVLQTDGATSNAIFDWTVAQSTGTGVFNPFVRLQGSPTEDGFNTDGTVGVNGTELDDVKGGIWTHSIKLTDVPIVNIGLNSYYEFGLDLDDPNAERQQLISLNALSFYRASAGNLTTIASLGSVLWELGPNSILMDGSLNPGNGGGDMRAYIPTSFLNSGSGDYLYLYSEFGKPTASSGGFEEWGLREVTAPIPEPSTYALMLAGLASIGFMARRRRNG